MTEVISRDVVLEAMDVAGLYVDDGALRDDYSGRAMYGETTFGLVTDLRGLLRFMVALTGAEEDEGWAEGLANAVRSDSMGLDSVYYFPGYKLSEE